MFRALCSHHQEVKSLLCSIWYHHTFRWSSRTQVDDEHIALETCRGM